MTPGKLENQMVHVEKALESVKTRLQVLNDLLPKASEAKPIVEGDVKGKGKSTTVQENPLGWTPKIESLENLTKAEIEAEIKDVTSLTEELNMKVHYRLPKRYALLKPYSYSWKTCVRHQRRSARQWTRWVVSSTKS